MGWLIGTAHKQAEEDAAMCILAQTKRTIMADRPSGSWLTNGLPKKGRMSLENNTSSGKVGTLNSIGTKTENRAEKTEKCPKHPKNRIYPLREYNIERVRTTFLSRFLHSKKRFLKSKANSPNITEERG